MLQPDIGGRREPLAHQRTEQQIVYHVPGQQRGLAPRTSDLEFQAAYQFTRVQIALGEWAGFVDALAANDEPVTNRIGAGINKLAKQVLVYIDGIVLVAADGELKTGVERDRVAPHPQHRVQSAVEVVVECVAVEDN